MPKQQPVAPTKEQKAENRKVIREIEINEARLSCFDAGSGHPILFVHGFPLNQTMWAGQLAHFQQGYRVLAPDLRGFGRSSSSTENVLTMEQFADDLNDLLDKLEIEEPITFCGFSMGGYIAWQFAAKYPQRLSRLILCDTKSVCDTPEAMHNRLVVAERVLAQGADFLAQDMVDKLFSPLTIQSHPEVVKEIQQVIQKSSPEAIAAASRGMAARLDFSNQLFEIEVPTLVMCGTDDVISTLEEMREIATKIPGAEFQEILGSGHMSPVEKPDLFNNSLQQFLEATDM